MSKSTTPAFIPAIIPFPDIELYQQFQEDDRRYRARLWCVERAANGPRRKKFKPNHKRK